ncbi:ParA family protein [Streptomyces sp. IBSNAI002]|uniref:ParA family protein n=1 Tax=Streptomyces sp. IBSNAI002 TaxID=3457500 RepID=UPI003FD1DA1C
MLIANVSPRTMAKTTDTAWLSHALMESDAAYEIEGYDADHSMQFWDWSKQAPFDFEVHKKATAQFHEEFVPTPGRLSIVDCGHAENHPHITDSVLRVADLVILHMSPTQADWLRVSKPPEATPFQDIIRRAGLFRSSGKPPETWVLLNRTVTNASSTAHYRGELEATGWNVFTTVIPRAEMFALSMNFPVIGAKKSAFGALVTEMTERGLLP